MQYIHRHDLIAPERLKTLMQRSDARAWRQWLSHLGAIGLSTILLRISYGSLWALPVFVVHGVLLNFLYAAQHEMMHGTAFRTRGLNRWFSRITGFVVLFPRDYDRIMHFAHHRHTNDPNRDPELMGYNEQAGNPNLAVFLWRLSCVPYWLRRVGRLVRVAAGRLDIEQYMSKAEQRTVIREARAHLAGYALLAGGSLALGTGALLWYWLLPLFATKWLHEVQNLVEHGALPLVDNVLENTRTIRTHPLLHWLAWNMQYHCDHHLFAAVPFYHLPALHREIHGHIHNVTPGYGAALAEVLAGVGNSGAVADGRGPMT